MPEQTRCPACASEDPTTILAVRETMFGRDESFRYAVCPACATLWLVDVPADLGAYYPTDYYSIDLDPEQVLGKPPVRQFAAMTGRSILIGKGRFAAGAGRAISKRQFHTLVSLLRSVRLAGLPRGEATTVLDVGCGSGMLVYALSLAGLRGVSGVDPFAAVDRRFDTGATLHRSDLADVQGQFDLVMFHHSFEHVPDPGQSLEEAKWRLRPGGHVLVRMPTVSSEAYGQYGVDWVQLDAPRHLTVFSREGVTALAARHGMRVVDTVDDSTSFQFWGSEQVRRGIALNAENSQMVDPKKSVFEASAIRAWDKQAARFNARGRGDQSVWVLATD